jgi:hypothetical protein
MKFKLSIKCLATRAYLSLLRSKYKFDPWHVTGNINCRVYKHQVLEVVKSLGAISGVVEIGCGLGDLVSNIETNERIGIDADDNVIKAAEYLNGKKCKFISGSFEDAGEYQADLLIMVNWIHELDPLVLANEIKKLGGRYKFLLVDAITSDREEYKYKHDFNFMRNIGELVYRLDCGPIEGRSILLYKFNS